MRFFRSNLKDNNFFLRGIGRGDVFVLIFILVLIKVLNKFSDKGEKWKKKI